MFNKQKRHYKSKIETTWKKIWDIQFLLAQYKLMREGFRVEYDRIKEELDAINTYKALIENRGIEVAKELMTKADQAMIARDEKTDYVRTDEDNALIETLAKNAKAKEDDVARLKKQMETLDLQTDGQEGGMLPNGEPSVKKTQENLRQVVDMLQEQIKSI